MSTVFLLRIWRNLGSYLARLPYLYSLYHEDGRDIVAFLWTTKENWFRPWEESQQVTLLYTTVYIYILFHYNYFGLDVEGSEYKILRAVSWHKVNIKVNCLL